MFKSYYFGNCGVLDSKIEDCSIIIPTKGFRDEGTSYHYVSPSETIEINPDYKEDFIKILNEYNLIILKVILGLLMPFIERQKIK